MVTFYRCFCSGNGFSLFGPNFDLSCIYIYFSVIIIHFMFLFVSLEISAWGNFLFLSCYCYDHYMFVFILGDFSSLFFSVCFPRQLCMSFRKKKVENGENELVGVLWTC